MSGVIPPAPPVPPPPRPFQLPPELLEDDEFTGNDNDNSHFRNRINKFAMMVF